MFVLRCLVKTNITRIIDTLEQKNLVVRVEDQIDHRIKRVVLTSSIVAMLGDANASIDINTNLRMSVFFKYAFQTF